MQDNQDYRDGKILFDRGQYSEAAALLLRAAESGHADAQNEYGYLCKSGLGVSQDLALAEAWYQKAAEQGHGDASHNLAVLLVERDGDAGINAAVEWLKVNASQGHAQSQLQLGHFYKDGSGVEASLNEALRLMRTSADQGQSDALFMVSLADRYGASDHKGPYPSYAQCEARAQQGDVAAMRLLGAYNMLGFGGKPDTTAARQWIERAAEGGDVPATRALGLFRFDEDAAAALACWETAAAAGDAYAMLLLGGSLLDGDAGVVDAQRGIQLLDSSAAKGCVDALVALGDHYCVGNVIQQDMDLAVHWYKRAAQAGHVESQCRLGMILAGGIGVAPDVSMGLHWLESAAASGWADAQCGLGIRYLKGDAVERDPQVGTRWLRAAAEQDDEDAIYSLGVCYRNGDGVPADPKFGEHLWRKAAALGHAEATAALGELGSQPERPPAPFVPAGNPVSIPAASVPTASVPPSTEPSAPVPASTASLGSLIVRQRWADAFVSVELLLVVLFIATWMVDPLLAYRGTLGWSAGLLFVSLCVLLPSDDTLGENKHAVELLAKEGKAGATLIAFLLTAVVGAGFHAGELLELAGYSRARVEEAEGVAGTSTTQGVGRTPTAETPAAATLFAVIKTGSVARAIPGLFASTDTYYWRERTPVIPIRFESRPGDYGPSLQLWQRTQNIDGSWIEPQFQTLVWLKNLAPESKSTPLSHGDWSALSQWEQQLDGLFSDGAVMQVQYFWNPKEADRYENSELTLRAMNIPAPPQLKGK